MTYSTVSPGVGLSALLDDPAKADFVVAWMPPVSVEKEATPIMLSELRRRVQALAQKISRDYPESRRWGLACQSSYQFTVGLLALLHAGKSTVLPPNVMPGTLREIAGDVDGFVTDSSLPSLDSLQLAPLTESNENLLLPLDHVNADAPLIELVTSGTSGKRKTVVKSVRQLEVEIEALQTLWCYRAPESLTVSSASHQHIYGLLYKICWPLSSGRAFYDPLLVYPEELDHLTQQFSDIFLVSTPTFLTHLPHLADVKRLKPVISFIVSSGAALKSETAWRCREETGRAVVEVFGSTETGGIAWRVQDAADLHSQKWCPLPGVKVRSEGTDNLLAVSSPFVSERSESDWYVGDDIISLHGDNTFDLLGRRGKVIKIGERRGSLTEIEEQIIRHPFLKDVAAVLIQQTSRAVVGLVCVLSEEGLVALSNRGKRRLSEDFRSFLLEYFDRVFLPRYFRFIERLPRDSQGKVSSQKLEVLFQNTEAEVETRPIAHQVRVGDSELRMELEVSHSLFYLNGHFPDFPIVPGFIQLDWVMRYSAQFLQADIEISDFEVAKFQKTLLPGDVFTLWARWKISTRSLEYRLFNDNAVYASGRVKAGSSPQAENGI